MSTEKIEQDTKLTQALLDFGEWSQKVLLLDSQRSNPVGLHGTHYIESIKKLTDEFFALVEKHKSETSKNAINIISMDSMLVSQKAFFDIYQNASESRKFIDEDGCIVQLIEIKKYAQLINIITSVIVTANILSDDTKLAIPSLIIISMCYIFYYSNLKRDKSRYLAPLEEILNETKLQLSQIISDLEN